MSRPDAPQPSASELKPLDPASVERFRRDVEALTSEPPSASRKLGLAVSGGPDSMAMLALAAAAYPGAVTAATVDHKLRAESGAEAMDVAEICRRLGVPHAIIAPPSNFSASGNLQQQARAFRYYALYDWAGAFLQPRTAEWVAVAHQRDDVAETFLMRARRGSGVTGLASMRRKRPFDEPDPDPPLLIRPLLDWSRGELADIVDHLGLKVAVDPSNADPRFDRARIRMMLAANEEMPAARLALSAHNLRHAEDALDWMFRREVINRLELTADNEVWLDLGDLPYELRRRLAWAAIQETRLENGLFDWWDARGIDGLIAMLDAGGVATLAGIKAQAKGGRWHFTIAPARRSH